MTIYAVVELNLKDKDKMAAYREKAGAALAKHGGAVVSAGPNPEVLEGDTNTPDMMVLVSFPDVEAARAWRADPELAETHALRNAGADSTITIVPGG